MSEEANSQFGPEGRMGSPSTCCWVLGGTQVLVLPKDLDKEKHPPALDTRLRVPESLAGGTHPSLGPQGKL